MGFRTRPPLPPRFGEVARNEPEGSQKIFFQTLSAFCTLARVSLICYLWKSPLQPTADNEPIDLTIDQALLEFFGFSEFRPGQRDVIENLMAGHSTLAVFPTGGGKSLCYQLPALLLAGLTVVISPLIALMKDQIDFLTRRGIAAARLDSSLSFEDSRDVTNRVKAGEVRLLYVAPERFTNERFLAMLKQVPVSLFAVDEAHCISEWGHNFRPDYLKLAETAKAIKAERVLALTATATKSVADDICTAFNIAPNCATVTGFFRPNLHISIVSARENERDRLLLQRMAERPPGPTIVYVTLQKSAERVAAVLAQAGLGAQAYHAGMESQKRTDIQEWWMGGSDRIVVATIAFGMGIDKANVRYVYHYNLPKSLESYSQEIGRAGRDGGDSVVEMLACEADVPILENFAYGDTPSLSSLKGLTSELLAQKGEFSVSLYDLSGRHDLKQLVLKTALTYLELAEIIKQGTPFYSGYKMRPLATVEQIVGHFRGEPAELVRLMFKNSRYGISWYTLNPDEMAVKITKDRGRIIRALEYLEQHSMIELTHSDLRHRVTVLQPELDPDAVAGELFEKFQRREQSEVARLRGMLKFIQLDTCLSNALAEYFGEQRHEPCGVCSVCLNSSGIRLDEGNIKRAPISLSAKPILELQGQHPKALGEPRQLARLLCGLGSPALTKLKLGKHPLFGLLESYPFGEVMQWCEALNA